VSVPGPLAGRRVALTGGSRGIGYAIAARLIADGAAVALCSRDLAAAEGAASRLRAEYPHASVHGFAADVTDTAAVDAFADAADACLGGVDSLVCNSGGWGPKGPLETFSFDEWLNVFDVNVHGVVRALRAFVPRLRAAGNGRIVIMSGGGSYQPYPYISGYAATKSAVTRLGESVAEELRPQGITLNMMLPGPVNTGMVDELMAAGPALLGEDRYAKVLKQKQSGGTPPERGAALCSYLLSDRIAGISGKLISVNDPYESLDADPAAIMAGDIYTLRRIT